jgi:hypothetical protein
MDEIERALLLQRIAQLSIEHNDLDKAIHRLSAELGYDRLQLQRIKRRKLALKDHIARLQRELDPDIRA